jgi:hypothetical protein
VVDARNKARPPGISGTSTSAGERRLYITDSLSVQSRHRSERWTFLPGIKIDIRECELIIALQTGLQ